MELDNKKRMWSFLNTVTEFMARSDGQTLEEVIDDLRASGVDYEAVKGRLMERLKGIQAAAKAQVPEEAQEKSLSPGPWPENFSERLHWTKEKIISRIRELTTMPERTFAVAYRGLESQSKDDLLSLLEDLEMAKARMENKE
ncbi:MAG: hypothetical protein ACOZFS_00210 [Thermodesulfobacteriota bacterium]